MDTVTNIYAWLSELNLDPMVVLMIIAGGFWSKRYLSGFNSIKIKSVFIPVNTAWKTLIVGTVLSLVYVVLLKIVGSFERKDILKIFYSYVFATSFYELIIGPISRWIKKKFGYDKEQDNDL